MTPSCWSPLGEKDALFDLNLKVFDSIGLFHLFIRVYVRQKGRGIKHALRHLY